MTNGKDFAEKMFSMNEDERLYSTGSEELDAMLEKAFCEGYEYAQREFACKDKECKEEEKKKHTGAKVAAGVGGTAALAGAGVYGAEKVGEAVVKKGSKKIGEATSKRASAAMERARNKDFGKELVEKAEKLEKKGGQMIKIGNKMQEPMKAVRNVAEKVVKRVAKK